MREWNDNVMIPQIMQLKTVNPNLKVIASVGGWNEGTATFRSIIQTASSRSTFNQNAIQFLRQWEFDGLDVDFEYPGDSSRGSPPSDRPLFTAWMQSLRSDFEAESMSSGKQRLQLGIAIGAGKDKIDNGLDVPQLSAALDFISVMTYDFHGGWESVTGYNAPLYPLPSWSNDWKQLTGSWAIDYLISKGADRSKLMMGIPFYGRSFTLNNANQNDIGAPASQTGAQGKYTGERGYNAYYETCMMTKCTTKPYTYIYDSTIKGPYMFYDRNWIATEDVNSIVAKVDFAKQRQVSLINVILRFYLECFHVMNIAWWCDGLGS